MKTYFASKAFLLLNVMMAEKNPKENKQNS